MRQIKKSNGLKSVRELFEKRHSFWHYHFLNFNFRRIFHAVSNVYIQKIMPPLTTKIKGTEHWLGENGIMFTIVTCIFGIYFWRKAIKEKL